MPTIARLRPFQPSDTGYSSTKIHCYGVSNRCVEQQYPDDRNSHPREPAHFKLRAKTKTRRNDTIA